MKNIAQNPEVVSQLEMYNLLCKDGRNYELLFTGTREECEVELSENWGNRPDGEIVKNEIRDQWENDVEGRGFVTFSNDVTIEYSL
jgi:hypothetical protein